MSGSSGPWGGGREPREEVHRTRLTVSSLARRSTVICVLPINRSSPDWGPGLTSSLAPAKGILERLEVVADWDSYLKASRRISFMRIVVFALVCIAFLIPSLTS